MIKHKSIHIERNVELTNRFNVLSSNLHTIMPGTFSSLESGSLFVSAVTLLKNRGFSISLLNRNREEAAGKKRANGRKREAWLGMPTGPGSMDFNPCSLPFFPLPSLSCRGTEGRKSPMLVVGGGGGGEEKMAYGGGGGGWDEGTVLSIGYISSRTAFPLRAAFLVLSVPIICRSHRAQTGRARIGESVSVLLSLSLSPSLTPTLSFSVCWPAIEW